MQPTPFRIQVYLYLQGQSHDIFKRLILRQTSPPWLLIHILKYFRKRGEFAEIFSPFRIATDRLSHELAVSTSNSSSNILYRQIRSHLSKRLREQNSRLMRDFLMKKSEVKKSRESVRKVSNIGKGTSFLVIPPSSFVFLFS
jgi:hypothetical protein